MGFAQESGYTPPTIAEIMLSIMTNVNTQFGTTYTVETFIGTGFYKYFYNLAQLVQQNEIKTSEIFLKLQDYFAITNESISRPVVTNPGLIEKLEAEGFVASVKKPIDADAGKVFVCVDTDNLADDYAAKKLEIATIIKDSTVAGVVSQGTQSTAIVLSNGQSFDFKFNLPDRIETLLRLTTTLSENNQVVIGDPDVIKSLLLSNINAKYRLGKNFEPQKYFGIADAPWASAVLLEYSIDDGTTWLTQIFDSEYDELLDISLENIELVEA